MHSDSVYTREMHERLGKELYESGMFTIADKSLNEQRFKLVHNNELGCSNRREYNVMLIGSELQLRTNEHSGFALQT